MPTESSTQLVAGETVTRRLPDFVRACETFIEGELAKVLPDNALVALLCDAVRLTREHEEAVDRLRLLDPVARPTPGYDPGAYIAGNMRARGLANDPSMLIVELEIFARELYRRNRVLGDLAQRVRAYECAEGHEAQIAEADRIIAEAFASQRLPFLANAARERDT